MAWLRISLTEEEQRIVEAERDSHPSALVRRRLLVIWSLHCGLTRVEAARIAGVDRSTVTRYVSLYKSGGLEALRTTGVKYHPVSELDQYKDVIRQSLEEQPVRTIAEACHRIEELTGIKRGPTQVAKFLKGMGLKWQRVRVIPVPPKKSLEEHNATQAEFFEKELNPVLEAAREGRGHVFFVDAAHFVFGTYLCCLWSFTRLFVRAASGRQRFNVLGAWNAVTRELVSVTNTTVVNTETMCELLKKIVMLQLAGPVTLVLDNARYQRNKVVMALAEELGIKLMFLPSYSPNLNLIERLWKFTKREAVYGHYHATFADFRAAIEETLDGIPTTHAAELATLMTHNFQRFENVSLMAA